MKIINAAVISLIAAWTVSTAKAEAIPAGCYVSDTEREWFQTSFGYSVDCYSSSAEEYNWLTPAEVDNETLYQAYGDVLAAFIKGWYGTAIEGQQLWTAYNQLSADYKKKESLEKKLRKACGSKCRRIK
jgi:hypothetical protein